MLWLVTDDISDYNVEKIQKDWEVDNVLFFPSVQEIKDLMYKAKNTNEVIKTACLSPTYPDNEVKYLFVIKKVKKIDILNVQQKYYQVDEAKALKDRLGITVTKTDLGFKDMLGFEAFFEWSRRLEIAKQKKLSIKPTFMLGVPGIGKSHSIACYAGERDEPMLDISLPSVLESMYPLAMLKDIFEFLHDTGLKATSRMDEIGEALKDGKLLSELLTIIDEINTPKGYRINGMLFATENNIRDLIIAKPQFFRHGRWNEKFFVHYYKEQAIKQVMKYYMHKYKVQMQEDQIEEVFYIAQSHWHDDNLDESRSVYVPSEINYLFERLCYYDEVGTQEIEAEIEYVIPQYRSAKEGLSKLIGDAKKNYFREV